MGGGGLHGWHREVGADAEADCEAASSSQPRVPVVMLGNMPADDDTHQVRIDGCASTGVSLFRRFLSVLETLGMRFRSSKIKITHGEAPLS